MSAPVVAPRKRDCSICRLPPDVITQVNAAIWPEAGVARRSYGYRTTAQRICRAQGLYLEVKLVTRHAEHIEESWHPVTPGRPAVHGEIPVHATDYQSVTDKAAGLGMAAMTALEGQIGIMEPRDLVAAAKLGVQAATQKEALRIRQQQADDAGILAAALFGAVSGTITQRDVPEAEVIDVTPVEDLLDEVHQARKALVRLQGGEAVAGG